MNLYAWNGLYSFTDKWPIEYVWLEEDHVLDRYEPDLHDIDKQEYLCEVHWGKYMRIKFRRRYEMHYKDFNSLDELYSYLKTCYENEEWFEIGFRVGVMMVDPWAD